MTMTDERHPCIRRATAADARTLAALGSTTFTETFGHLYPPEDLTAFLEKSYSFNAVHKLLGDAAVAAWLATGSEGEPMGYAIAGPCKLPVENLEPRAGEIRQLYLLGQYQKLGLGSRLLALTLEWLAEQKYSPLYVGVWSENHGAQRLYGRHGFSKIGEYGFPVGRQVDREFILRQGTLGTC